MVTFVTLPPRAQTGLLRFTKGSLVTWDPNLFYRIQSGTMKTYAWQGDELVPLGLWFVGDLVGSSLYPSELVEAQCLTDLELEPIKPQEWGKEEITKLIHQFQRVQELVQILRCRNVTSALNHLLDWLANCYGIEHPQGTLIDVRLTHQDIAALLGSTRVTITRSLRTLQDQGIIQRESGHRILLMGEIKP